MQAYGQIGKTALPGAHLPAVGEQAVAHDLSGISGKKGTCRVIGGCRMAQPDTAFLIQILVPESVYRFIHMNAFHNDPVDKGQVVFHQFLLFSGQGDIPFHKCSPLFKPPCRRLELQANGTGQ